MPNQPKHPLYTIRLDPAVKAEAMARAEDEGSNLSERVRQWITNYAATGSPVVASAGRARQRSDT